MPVPGSGILFGIRFITHPFFHSSPEENSHTFDRQQNGVEFIEKLIKLHWKIYFEFSLFGIRLEPVYNCRE